MAHLVCQSSKKRYPLNSPIWQSEVGGLLDVEFETDWNWASILSRKPSLWRYLEALPIDNEANIISLGEGFTPIQEIEIAQRKVWLKLEYLFPSGSYKDRGASVLISKAKELGITSVVQDSSGNAGASIAQYAARAGIQCQIFVPKDTSPSKLIQIQSYGADLCLIEGSREDTAYATKQATQRHYYASHVYNPFFLQGTKTFAYEVFEQLREKLPDTLVLPAGNGTLLLGAYIGFQDLKRMCLIDKIPKLVGIQAENNAPIYQMFQTNLQKLPHFQPRPTLAEGIAIAQPVRAKQIIEYVKQTRGIFLAVSEEQIIQTWHFLAKKGYFVEPTSAAVVAGLEQYILHYAQPNEKILSVLTGSGLKAIDKIQKIFLK
ncbi:MAG: threonine synthase [Microscillaceae bacterium]|nr:threonine synthase [Microscillaceae bacterium]MDW8461508.1 threonine synthase [Cytophagales bacterium]